MRTHLTLAVALLLAACQQDPPGTCASHFECNVGQECSGGVCIALVTSHQVGSRCVRDADCVAWAGCAGEVCTLAAGMCTTGADCAGWQLCDNGHACIAAAGRCASAAQCAAWEVCNASNTCENGPGYCASGADCEAWQQCSAVHACATAAGFCADDAGCAGWQYCAADHQCDVVPGMCGTSADCASWDLCEATHVCVHGPGYCATSGECSPWEECSAVHACVAAPGFCNGAAECESWQQCNATHTCGTAPGFCASGADCATWQQCGAAHACVAAPGFCAGSADCQTWEVCNGTSHTCEHGPGYCASSADCAAWQQCDAVHACVAAPGFCGTSTDCRAWEVCNGTSHACENGPGYCASSADCAAWQQCDAVHACVAAPGFCGTSTDCRAWEVCNASHTCENGPQYCATSATCETWQQCGTEHVCVPGLRRCGTSADCEYAWESCGADHTCETGPGYCFDSSDCTAPQLCYEDHHCATPPARCASDRDCPWYTRCDGPLLAETCQLLDAVGHYPQHCYSDAQCAGLACRDNRCVERWRVVQVAAANTTCALTSAQQVWCWGWGNQGLLGADQTMTGGPYLVPGSDGAVALATSGGTGFLTFADGSVRGWGYNGGGQLCEPAGNPNFYATPGPVIPALAGVTKIHGYPICGIDPSTNLVCWGDNTYGPIPGAPSRVETPTLVPGLPSGVTAFDASNHVCVVAAGELWCWASTFGNDCGQTGRTPGVTDAVPTRVDLGAPVLDVATGAGGFTCAIVQGGGVKCWGCNYYGNVGNGSTSVDPVLVPTDVVGLAGPAAHVAITDWTACALLASGGVQCWGRGDRGYLANGDLPDAQLTPRYALRLESGVAQLDMGSAACALKTDGTLWCWGWAHDWDISGDFEWPFYYPVQVNAPP